MAKHTVWDIPTRLFHWLLVGLIFFQWLTIEVLDDTIELHMYGGYALLGLIIFRVLWGLIGTQYARFSNFIYPLATTIEYARQLPQKDSPSYPGHNPMGGLAVILMLTLVLAQAVSGLFITDDIFSSGPYYSAVSSDLQDLMATVHHQLFDIILVVICLHVVTVMIYVFYKQQALVSAMIHGKKQVPEDQAIASQQVIKAIVLAVVVAIFMYFLIEVWPPDSGDYYY